MPENAELARDEELVRTAGQIDHALRILIQHLRRSHYADVAASKLTLPQVAVLSELAEADGLGLSELSHRMRLAHSTVSGIIDRLELRGVVERRTDPGDKRFTRIYLSDYARDLIREVLPNRRLRLLVEALRGTQAEERAVILEGLTILCRRLTQPVHSLGCARESWEHEAGGLTTQDSCRLTLEGVQQAHASAPQVGGVAGDEGKACT